MIKSLDDPRLLFRRQFFLGPRFVDFPGVWEKLKITDDWYLTSQADLEVSIARRDDKTLVLLGFVFDYRTPKKTNQQILEDLAISTSFDEILENSKYLSGRWALAYFSANEAKIFHDAAGCRQIYYYTDHTNITWCASQPHTLAKLLKIAEDDDPNLLAFMNSEAFSKEEYAWIGDGSPYTNVKHLLTNFFLDLVINKKERYWPVKSIHTYKLDEAVELSAQILSNSLKAASERYRLAIALTGGLDSRVLLAACKSIKHKARFFVFKAIWMTYDFKDIIVPKKLAKKFKLDFRVYSNPEAGKKLLDLVKFNSHLNHLNKLGSYSLFFDFFQDYLVIGGNVAPIVKSHYQNTNKDSIPTPQLLAMLYGREGDKFAQNEIANWLDDLQIHIESHEIHSISVFDLYWWEHREANWGGANLSDSDFAVERYFPFNCRYLLEIQQAVELENRVKPNYHLQKKIITKLWPEVLYQKINPPSKSIKYLKILQETNTYPYMRKLYRFVKKL